MDAGSGKLVGMSVLPRHLSSEHDLEFETSEAHSEIALLYAGNLHL
jgi:hypothetical protein